MGWRWRYNGVGMMLEVRLRFEFCYSRLGMGCLRACHGGVAYDASDRLGFVCVG